MSKLEQMHSLLGRIEEKLDDNQYSLLDELCPQALEILHRLILADGRPVQADFLCHQLVVGVTRDVGSWSTAARAATVVSNMRRILGNDAILTVRGLGYVLGTLPEGL
jgi:DNA-binding response OmpR family regulator